MKRQASLCEQRGYCDCPHAWMCKDGKIAVPWKGKPLWPTFGPLPATPFQGQCMACTQTTFHFGCRSRCPACPPSGDELVPS